MGRCGGGSERYPVRGGDVLEEACVGTEAVDIAHHITEVAELTSELCAVCVALRSVRQN